MSIKVTSRVWDHARYGSARAMIVLNHLADRSDDEGVSWPSIPSIAAKARIKVRRTQDIIHSLEASGDLWVMRHTGGRPGGSYASNLYFITCGLTQDEIHRILVYHARIGFPSKEAAVIAAEISSKQRASKGDLRVQENAPLNSELNGAENDTLDDSKGAEGCTGNGATSDPKGAEPDALKGATSCAPYKEETSEVEPSEETPDGSESARGAAGVKSISSEPPIRKPRRADFPEAALPLLRALLEIKNQFPHWQMDLLPRPVEDKVVRVAGCWHLDGRRPEDVRTFWETWPKFIAQRTGNTGAINEPTVGQWIDNAADVLAFAVAPLQESTPAPRGRQVSAEVEDLNRRIARTRTQIDRRRGTEQAKVGAN